MGKKWNPESVSMPGSLLPDGIYTMKVIEGEESETKNGKYMPVVRARVVSPAKHKNAPSKINFVIGTDDDPGADEDETKGDNNFALKRYKSLLFACEVPQTGDFEEELEALAGKRFVVDCGHSEDSKYQEFRAFLKEGSSEVEEEVAVVEEEEEEEAPVAKKAAKVKRAAKPAADDDDWD